MLLRYMLPKECKLILSGNTELDIEMLNLCNRNSDKRSVLSYVTNKKYRDVIRQAPHIKAILCYSEDQEAYKELMEERDGCLLLSENPEIDFYTIHESLYRDTDFYNKHVYPTEIGKNCNIHPTAVVDEGGGINRKQCDNRCGNGSQEGECY